MVNEEDVRRAYDKLYGADEVFRAAEKAVNAQAAYVLRLELAQRLELHELIAGYKYSSEFCYDDEGGYFRSIYITPIMDIAADQDDEAEAEGDMQDVQPWSIDAVQQVFDHGDEWEGTVSREELLSALAARA